MNPAPSSRRRRACALTAATVATAIAAVPVAASAGPADSAYTTNCPRAESLVRGTTWHSHTLATGLTLQEGQHADPRGYVRMHVLRIDMTSRHLSFAPLVRKLAMRTPLSQLAAGRPHLLAATNTGYFDFGFGTPLGPVMTGGQLMTGTARPQDVVGINTVGLAQFGQVGLKGTVTAGGSTRGLAGINVLYPGAGITAYSPQWGSTRVAIPRNAIARYVDAGQVSSKAGRYDTPPSAGYLLVASGYSPVNWLESLRRGSAITVTRGTTSSTARPFRQAYGVGEEIVNPGGVARTGLTCRRRYPQPARTAVGVAGGGRELIIALVEDRPGTAMHGLDANQMARVMADLGAKQAYLFDGSGSTELLARLRSNPTVLAQRTYPADGAERAMPLGFGIFSRN